MRIAVEVSVSEAPADGAELLFYIDAAGRNFLVRELLRLEFPAHDHFHVYSPAWMGEGDLSDERRDAGSVYGRHLKISLRPDGEEPFSPQK